MQNSKKLTKVSDARGETALREGTPPVYCLFVVCGKMPSCSERRGMKGWIQCLLHVKMTSSQIALYISSLGYTMMMIFVW